MTKNLLHIDEEDDVDEDDEDDEVDEDDVDTETVDDTEEDIEDNEDSEDTDAAGESEDQAVVKKSKAIARSQPLPDLFAEPSPPPLPSLSAPWPLRRSTRFKKAQQDEYRMSLMPTDD